MDAQNLHATSKRTDDMQVLIVDSNIIFAKRVAKFLKENKKEEVNVEFAQNVPILQRRLRTNNYDYIIADVVSAFDSDGMTDALKTVQTPTIVWSVTNSPKEIYETFCHHLSKRVIEKPSSEQGIAETMASISSLMLPAVR